MYTMSPQLASTIDHALDRLRNQEKDLISRAELIDDEHMIISKELLREVIGTFIIADNAIVQCRRGIKHQGELIHRMNELSK